ncbi:MAG: PKD domain-containing protein [Bacteroidetes bacterium]|nr:PKD domain-containing protein [Bacteroidota bacterium]
MEFVENKGQWHELVQYKGDFNGGSFFLEQKGFTVLLHNTKELSEVSELGHSASGKSVTLHSFAYKVALLDATQHIKTIPEKPMDSYNNYFVGNDPQKWAGRCRIFQAITYKNVYPDIDLRYYSNGGRLKYDFIVYPGGNPSNIALKYDGPELMIKDKELIIKTPIGDVKELYPYSYQPSPKGKQEVDCRYVLKNNILTFTVKGYDPAQTLIIDPTIIFSSFTGSTADNWGYTATPGPDGTLFAGGIVFADPPQTGFPVSAGAFQTTYGGGVTENNFAGYDIGIFKFSANGSNRIYATYLGGNGNEQPHSMIVDRNGNLTVAGRTTSANFPTTTSRIGPGGNFDIILTKFNAAGDGLLGSVVIGGTGNDGVNIRPKYSQPQGADGIRRNYGDDARSEVILDGGGNVILASCTQSTDFPIAGGAIQSTFGGGRQDGVILKFNSNLSSYIFGNFFGGSGDDACFVSAINPLNGDIYVGGATTSNTLPGNTTGVISGTFNGGISDGFVTAIRPDGSATIKTTFLGTSGTDMLYGLKFDRSGFPYVMGTTTGAWPVINAAFVNPGSGQFISKLRPDLSAMIYSTVFGTGGFQPNISPIAFLVDRCENVYVSGWGGGLNNAQGYNNGKTFNLPEVDPLQGIPGPDGNDFYFFVLKKDAASQLFGSHFGQNGGLGDHVDGGTSRFDDNGVIYQAICANCGRDVAFPTTPSAWARNNGSADCNEALVKIKMNYAGVGAGLQTLIDNVVGDTSGCVPLTVTFKDTLYQGVKVYWNFGDGTPEVVTTDFEITHTYNNVGHYLVRLIAEDPTTCNVRDTAYVTIRVGNNIATLDFVPVKDTPCTSLAYTFYNHSTSTFPPAFNPQTFTWDFGDGSPTQVAFDGRHTFPAPGVYQVTLTLVDTNYCNSPVSLTKEVRVYPLVKAAFTTSQLGCAPYTAAFTFTGGGAGTEFYWSFGDGTFSTDPSNANPTHYYPNPGVYAVQLIVKDTNTCNKIDTSAYFNITVLEKPVAKFTFTPNPPQRNTATQFINQSTGATRYLWDFGEEGETSTEVNPKHQFNATGSFTVTLTAYNQNNCDSTVTLRVDAIVDPLLDVPNAFTPGRFGENGNIAVKGYGIGKMDWRIYNRWGQLVFHTTNRKQSWDGKFKGKLLPMDVYAYTLDVVFTDGKTLRKTGDITLLR